MSIDIRNCDCMKLMAEFPDGYFNLAIVDPPYGIKGLGQASGLLKRYGQLETVNDLVPNDEYFEELFRVSKNQIVWGFNHLSNYLPTTKEFVFWYKHQPLKSFSDGELAWTSFKKTAKCFDFPFFGAHGREKIRIHPTQKPVILYRWLLKQYANKGDMILDTHLGSGSIVIACNELGFDLVGSEIDKTYFNGMKQRIKLESKQMRLV